MYCVYISTEKYRNMIFGLQENMADWQKALEADIRWVPVTVTNITSQQFDHITTVQRYREMFGNIC